MSRRDGADGLLRKSRRRRKRLGQRKRSFAAKRGENNDRQG